MDLQLTDTVAIVTGGASGIGFASACVFLAEGARVAVWDIAGMQPEQLTALRPFEGRWMACTADVCSQDSLSAAREQVLSKFGSYQHVVHAAAIGSGKFGFPFSNLCPADWERVLEVNVMGMVRVAHCLVPLLREAGRGSLTFLASVAGQIGSQTDPPYSASKAANINFAQCLAKDLATHSVRVNVVNPGMVKTPLNESVWRAWRGTRSSEPEPFSYEQWAEEKIRQVVPLGRWQTVDEVADAIVFLASERAASITGQCLNVDGGFVMHS